MTKIAGKVSIFSPGKEGIPGVKLIDIGWKNARKDSRLLHKQLEGEYVELTLDDEDYITGVEVIQKGIRSSGSAKEIVDEFFSVYNLIRARLVPKNIDPKESYAVRELEVQALKVSIELCKMNQGK